MRRLTVAAFVSLDGVMQAPGGPDEDPSAFAYGGWVAPHWDDVTDEAGGRLLEGPIALLLGRRTYDIFAAHWPRVQDDPTADALNAMPKYVATRSPGPLEWNNSHAIGPDAAQAVRALKAEAGPDLLTQGSSDLMQTLLAEDLVDRFVLLTFPLLLGPGKRMFGEGTRPISLKLTDTQVSSNGNVISTYERDGAVRTGSFALPDA